MKIFSILLSPFLFFSCESSNREITGNAESIWTKSQKDSMLLMVGSTEFLKSVKTRNYKKLVSYIHPVAGVRFSPYAYIDTATSRIFLRNELILIAKESKRVNWHTSWEDKHELMTIDEYFSKFVYDVDFLNAELKSLNKYHSQGTDLNNIAEVYPGCDVVEFFFSGFEEKYAGMDFRSLRLVFKMHQGLPYLVAIVHDQWTP